MSITILSLSLSLSTLDTRNTMVETRPLSLSFISIFFFLLLTHITIATSHGHEGFHLPFQRRNATTHENSNVTLSLAEAQQIVDSFHEAMAIANAARRENPSGNSYTIYTPDEIEEAEKPAPYLDYDTADSTAARKLRRHLLRRQLSNGTMIPDEEASSETTTHSYTIPPEVVEAAKLLAEANPPDTSSDEYDAIVASMKERFAPKNADTNAMPQKMQRPSGLFEFVGNATEATPQPDDATFSNEEPALKKRILASEFWMENIVQRGASPLAPTGYQVWRNVKDYGAVGMPSLSRSPPSTSSLLMIIKEMASSTTRLPFRPP